MEAELRVPIHGVPYDTCLGPLKDIFETKLESARVTKIGDAKRREGFANAILNALCSYQPMNLLWPGQCQSQASGLGAAGFGGGPAGQGF